MSGPLHLFLLSLLSLLSILTLFAYTLSIRREVSSHSRVFRHCTYTQSHLVSLFIGRSPSYGWPPTWPPSSHVWWTPSFLTVSGTLHLSPLSESHMAHSQFPVREREISSVCVRERVSVSERHRLRVCVCVFSPHPMYGGPPPSSQFPVYERVCG